MIENYRQIPDDILAAINIDTAPTDEERAHDEWDSEYNCNYSHDGKKLLDAENFPGTVKVREGTRVICDEAFAFQPYMAEDRPVGSDIPEDERISFLDKIYLPPSVKHIGKRAFMECGWIRSIRLPKELLTIGFQAFAGCWELRHIACPASLISIGQDAFCECFSLEAIRLNKELGSIGSGAFAYCTSLEEITLPEGLILIGEDIFDGCRSLRRIYVHKDTIDMYRELLPEKLHRKLRVRK